MYNKVVVFDPRNDAVFVFFRRVYSNFIKFLKLLLLWNIYFAHMERVDAVGPQQGVGAPAPYVPERIPGLRLGWHRGELQGMTDAFRLDMDNWTCR